MTFELPQRSIEELREFLSRNDWTEYDGYSSRYVFENFFLVGHLGIWINGESLFRIPDIVWYANSQGDVNIGVQKDVDSTEELGALYLLNGGRRAIQTSVSGLPTRLDLGNHNYMQLERRGDELCFEFSHTYNCRCVSVGDVEVEANRFFAWIGEFIVSEFPDLPNRPEAASWFWPE
ncbi:MAG: hypothetical protein ABIV92_12935 [Thermoflexales bacterium]